MKSMVLRRMLFLLLTGSLKWNSRAERLAEDAVMESSAMKDSIALERTEGGKDKPWSPDTEPSEFIRQQRFSVLVSGLPQGLKDKLAARAGRQHTGVWVVLTSTHLLVYKAAPACPHPSIENDNTGCKYSDNGVPMWWMDISTIEAGTVTKYIDHTPETVPELMELMDAGYYPVNSVTQYCMKLTGLVGETQDKVSTEVCTQSSESMNTWRKGIEQAFLDAHGIKGGMIGQKVRDASDTIEMELHSSGSPGSSVPEAMAPLLCLSNRTKQSLGRKSDIAHLDARAKFTKAQAVPFRPGKNSRSKAKFFFSADRSMIIKMIREEEYRTLWGMVSDCSYSRRLTDDGQGKSSLLNPIILAFMNSGQYWIIIRSEYVPAAIAETLPPEGSKWRHDFHSDIKPGNMVSDRKEWARIVMNERMLTGLQMIPALDAVLARLEIDVDYLAGHKLMDYSLFVFGSFIKLDHNDAGSRDFFFPGISASPGSTNLGAVSKTGGLTDPSPKQQLQQAAKAAPQCGMACSDRPRNLVDVTKQLFQQDRYLGNYYFSLSGKIYRCCCIQLKPGDSAVVRSPCALVQLPDGAGKGDCGGLLGSRFHSYHRASVGGKCLIDWDQWPETAGLKFIAGRNLAASRSSDPAANEIASRVESCAVVCVSVADYLLQSTIGKEVENVALIPVYGERKWSFYDMRTIRMFRCLIGGQPPSEPPSEDKKRPGLVTLFLPASRHGPPQPNEMTWKDCKEDFPEIRALDDMHVVEKLVQTKL